MNPTLVRLDRAYSGDVVEPGAADYESASRVLFASGSPAYVLRPASVADVQAVVKFAVGNGVSPRCTGRRS